MAKSYRRGDLVKYEGTIDRFVGTWWTIDEVNRASTGRIINYTLINRGIGRLLYVAPVHISQDRQDA